MYIYIYYTEQQKILMSFFLYSIRREIYYSLFNDIFICDIPSLLSFWTLSWNASELYCDVIKMKMLIEIHTSLYIVQLYPMYDE